VGVFLPSSSVKESFRSAGIAELHRLGYRTREVSEILSQNGMTAKTPEQGLEDLRLFFLDPKIDALWAARGGYGANLLLPHLQRIGPAPAKPVIGSSDVSYLLWFLLDRFQMVVFYGPMAYSALAENRYRKADLKKILTGNYREIRYRGRVIKPGKSAGILTGGCLTNFASLVGTPYLPETNGRILLLEDINERPYRLDRLLWQIEQSGLIPNLSGLLLGEFPGCFRDSLERREFEERLRRRLEPYRFPVIGDLPFGHARRCSILPLGVTGIIDTESFPGLMLREKGVRP